MTAAKERPILFSAPMVNAILNGTKTQTRRAFSKRTKFSFECAAKIGEVSHFLECEQIGQHDLKYILSFCPYGKVGDQLWVRETHYLVHAYGDPKMHVIEIDYKADPNYTVRMCPQKWRPSIHMPRFASRIQLEITEIRVERLQSISETDAIAEGMDASKTEAAQAIGWHERPVRAFQRLWEQINGIESWQENPWVWVVEFKRINSSTNTDQSDIIDFGD